MLGGGGDYTQIVPLKITIVVLNDSLVIFWMVFISVLTTFDLHCMYICKFFLCVLEKAPETDILSDFKGRGGGGGA